MMISSSHPLSFVAMFHHYDEVVVLVLLVLVVALCRHRRRGDDVASVSVCVYPMCEIAESGGTHTHIDARAVASQHQTRTPRRGR